MDGTEYHVWSVKQISVVIPHLVHLEVYRVISRNVSVLKHPIDLEETILRLKLLVTARMGKVLFSVCSPLGVEVPQSQVLSLVSGPRFFPGGTPYWGTPRPGHNGVPCPWPGLGYPPPPPSGLGYLHPGQDRTAEGTLAT